MFNSLTGEISGHAFPAVYLRTGGVEWEVEVSAQSFQALVRSTSAVRVFTWLHHREDVMRLYGFAGPDEREAFTKLLTVSGIGPRQALKILSATTVPALFDDLESENLDGLTRLPGLGKKTAQKMILQLKGTLVSPAEASRETAPTDDIARALVEMGYARVDVERCLDALRASIDDEQELFRQAIVALTTGSHE